MMKINFKRYIFRSYHRQFKLKSWLITVLFFTIGFNLSLNAEQLISADEIVNKASLSAYYGGDDGRSLVRMTIVDTNEREQTRQFTIIRKDSSDGGEQKYLVVFSRPTDVKDTVFMVHKKPGFDDDRWLYLPALDLVKRISSGDKRTSFVGAHFFYEDVSGRSPAEDNHSLVEQTDQYYVLEHQPKDASGVEFFKYKSWIDKQTFLPMKIEYYHQDNSVFRMIEALEVETVQGIATVTKSKVSNMIDRSYTLMEFKNMTYDIGIPEDLFSERSLRNPPTKWLKSR